MQIFDDLQKCSDAVSVLKRQNKEMHYITYELWSGPPGRRVIVEHLKVTDPTTREVKLIPLRVVDNFFV